MDIAIIGCGKIGSCMAACYAGKHSVKVYDPLPDARKAMATGSGLPKEPSLDALFRMNRENITVCWDAKKAVKNAKIIFVIVPTPSTTDGVFSQDTVISALKPVASVLADSKMYQVVAVNSTVTPESSEKEIIPFLETTTGKRRGNGWGYCYNPHFIAMGSVCSGLTNPDYHLIGQAGEKEGEILHNFYSHLTHCATIRMSVVSAEMAKLALNCALSVKAYFANMVAGACQETAGANALAVLTAVGKDRRIGPDFLRSGPPPAGPCLPRDLRCFSAYASRKGCLASLADACIGMREDWINRVAWMLKESSPNTVAILGLSYKPGVYLDDETPAIELANTLRVAGYKVLLHDPYAEHDSLEDCLQADSIFLHTPHPCYVGLESLPVRPDSLFLDAWGCLDGRKMKEKCDYRVFGNA